MAWPPLSPWYGLELVAGVFMLALAGAVAVLDFANRLNRALAALLTVRGVLNITFAFVDSGGGPYWERVTADFLLIMPLFLAYFLYAFYRDALQGRRGRWIPLLLLVWGGALVAAYLRDRTFAEGWLGQLVTPNFYVIYALVAYALFRAAARPGTPPVRAKSMVLVALGFILLPAYSGACAATALPLLATEGRLPQYLEPYGVTAADALGWTLYAQGFVMLAAGILVWHALGHRRLDGDAGLRRTGRWLLGAAFATAVVPPVAHALGGPATGGLYQRLFDQAWTLAFPLFVTYALVRYQLFGLDYRIKWTIHRGTVAAALAATGLVVSQLVQSVSTEQLGWAAGAVAAGLLLFGLAPLQRFANRVAEGALPGVKPVTAMDAHERRAHYREWVEAAWSDGRLTKKDRRMLELARNRLGIPGEEALRIEANAVRP